MPPDSARYGALFRCGALLRCRVATALPVAATASVDSETLPTGREPSPHVIALFKRHWRSWHGGVSLSLYY
jgi:hypothetical protein